eukprot:g584.t1
MVGIALASRTLLLAELLGNTVFATATNSSEACEDTPGWTNGYTACNNYVKMPSVLDWLPGIHSMEKQMGKMKATMDQKLKPFEKGMHEEREGDGDLSRTAKSIT